MIQAYQCLMIVMHFIMKLMIQIIKISITIKILLINYEENRQKLIYIYIKKIKKFCVKKLVI